MSLIFFESFNQGYPYFQKIAYSLSKLGVRARQTACPLSGQAIQLLYESGASLNQSFRIVFGCSWEGCMQLV
jgi:hypothetical protein